MSCSLQPSFIKAGQLLDDVAHDTRGDYARGVHDGLVISAWAVPDFVVALGIAVSAPCCKERLADFSVLHWLRHYRRSSPPRESTSRGTRESGSIYLSSPQVEPAIADTGRGQDGAAALIQRQQ